MTQENFMMIAENAFSQEFCNSTIDYFNNMVEAGFVRTRQQENPNVLKTVKDDQFLFLGSEDVVCNVRTRGIGEFFNNGLWNAYSALTDQFDALKNSGLLYNHEIKIQKTAVGGGYHGWHYEADNVENSRRVFAYILYLNDVAEGGETEFLYLHKRIKPKAGTLVIFPSGFTHTHRGNPPLSNEKYILTGWLEY